MCVVLCHSGSHKQLSPFLLLHLQACKWRDMLEGFHFNKRKQTYLPLCGSELPVLISISQEKCKCVVDKKREERDLWECMPLQNN